jgi:hypothetical protein
MDRRIRLRFALVVVLVVAFGVACVLLSACTDSGRSPSQTVAPGAEPATQGVATKPVSEQAYEEFLTAVAKPLQRNFTVYWLGREFSVSTVRYDGPRYAKSLAANSQDELDLTYNARRPDNTGGLNLGLYIVSAAGWNAVKYKLLSGVTAAPRDLTVAGRPAQLYAVKDRLIVNELVAVVDFGDALAVATTSVDAGDPRATPNANPLIDEATFLSALQNLRPYPQ